MECPNINHLKFDKYGELAIEDIRDVYDFSKVLNPVLVAGTALNIFLGNKGIEAAYSFASTDFKALNKALMTTPEITRARIYDIAMTAAIFQGRRQGVQNTMRALLLLILGFSCTSVFAENINIPQVLDKRYVQAIEQLSSKLTECQKSEKTIDISNLLAKGYNKENLKKLIAYYYAQAKYECSKAEYTQYLVHSAAYSSFLPPEANDKKKKIDALVTSYEKYRWQAIQDFSKLPEELKAYSQSLAYLKQPFELFSVIEQLNSIQCKRLIKLYSKQQINGKG